MKNAVLSLERATFRFKDAKKSSYAFKDVSFSLAEKEFVSIIGPSGAGKSTLLRAIAGVIFLTSGTVVKNFKKPAMIFQGHGIFPWLTALDNAAFGLFMEGMPKQARQKRAREKMKEVGLAGLEERYPHQLSGGQRQRVAIARAIAIEPDLLLMDEPFASLDSLTSTSLKKDILELWERYKMSVLMVNHIIADAVELSDRVIIFSKEPGTIRKIETIELPRPRDTRSKDFFLVSDRLTGMIEN